MKYKFRVPGKMPGKAFINTCRKTLMEVRVPGKMPGKKYINICEEPLMKFRVPELR